MQVVLISSNYAPHFEGGTERVVRAQARALKDLGVDVRVFCSTDESYEGNLVQREELDGIEVLRFWPEGEELTVELDRPQLCERVAAEVADADLVHVHHWWPWGSGLVRALAPTPVAITLHDMFATCPRFFRLSPNSELQCPERGDWSSCALCIQPHDPERSLQAFETHLAQRSAAFELEVAAAAALLAPSRCHAERMEALLGLDPGSIAVLGHGLCEPAPASAAGAGAGERQGWDGNEQLVIFHSGHRSRAKGTLDLVRALSSFPAGRLRLDLAGKEVEAGFDDELRAAAGGLELRFLGSYRPQELPALCRQAHLAAFPSRAPESYGLVLDEVLALGLPAWVSDRGALSERVGSAGCILPAEKPAAWEDAVRQLLHNPAILQEQRRALPGRMPTAQDAAQTLHQLYQSILARRPLPRSHP